MQFLDLKALSASKGIPVSTIRKYIKNGLPHYRPDRKIYICPKEFDQWFVDTCKPLQHNTKETLDNLIRVLTS